MMEKLLQDTIYDAIKRDIERAERAAYLRALDDVKESILSNGFFSKEDIVAVIDQMKSDYEKGKTE
jgi:uncharacterized protein YeeX (DUF496 family)